MLDVWIYAGWTAFLSVAVMRAVYCATRAADARKAADAAAACAVRAAERCERAQAACAAYAMDAAAFANDAANPPPRPTPRPADAPRLVAEDDTDDWEVDPVPTHDAGGEG